MGLKFVQFTFRFDQLSKTSLAIILFLMITIGTGMYVYAVIHHAHASELPLSYQQRDWTEIINDGVWFSLQTLTTTGYGSLPNQEVWSWDLKFYSSILMIIAAIFWATVVGEFIKRGTGRRTPSSE
jgi:ion channel